MGDWRASRAAVVLAALMRIGWTVARQKGSHKVLKREGWQSYVFAFHDGEDVGPKMLRELPSILDSSPMTFEANAAQHGVCSCRAPALLSRRFEVVVNTTPSVLPAITSRWS